MIKKLTLIFVLFTVLFMAVRLELFSYLSFDYLRLHLDVLQQFYQSDSIHFLVLYFLAYIFVTAFSVPGGATLLTFFGGAVMGFWPSLISVSMASTIGATLAFWVSRFLFRDFFEKKFKKQAKVAREEVQKNGIYYLFSLRLIPIFPFFIVNIVMGLTVMKAGVFFIVSLLGMIPGIAIYILAGQGLASIRSPAEIFSLKLFLLFTIIGLFPLLVKYFFKQWRLHKLYHGFKRPKHFDYNTIVIGAGAAGLVSAFITSSLKAKVALIEKKKMGGDCLYTGCVPSKALIAAARRAQFCQSTQDFSLVMENVKRIQKEIEPHDSRERYSSLGVDCLEGPAEIISPYEVKINGKTITARNLILATGALPQIPTIKGLDSIAFVTSETIWELKTLPEKLLILGGGPIGCEMAQAFFRLGSTVTLVESGRGLLPKEDEDVSAVIEKEFRSQGIELFFFTEAKEFVVNDGKKTLIAKKETEDIHIVFDCVLLATGRRANTSGLGLEKMGVELNSNATIKTNKKMQTNFPNIFACGDVAGPYQLTHVGAYQAWFAAVNSLFGNLKTFQADYRSVSWCTFTDPEVATAGMNELMLKENDYEYDITYFPFSELDRAIVEGHSSGHIKVLTKKGSDKILGASIVGHEAGILIVEFVFAIKYNIGMKDILNTIHPYPTMGEGAKYAAGVWQKNNKPKAVLKILEKYFTWRRN